MVWTGVVFAIAGIAISSAIGVSSWSEVLVNARELYGLWALALLLTAMAIGPLVFVLPWLPLRGHLAIARRPLGAGAFVFAVCHVTCYLVPTLIKDRHLLYTPGKLWILGLLLGVPMFVRMGALAFTSSDTAVHRLGGHRWKRLHRSVYWLLPIVFVHAVFLGVDFGSRRGPDVTAEPDAGSLIGMIIFAGAWLSLFLLRRKRIRWISLRFWRAAQD